MLVELTPATYLLLTALVQDALLHESDAMPLLKRAAQELEATTGGGLVPSELIEEPERLEALRRAGLAA